jgi:hypothetical protein
MWLESTKLDIHNLGHMPCWAHFTLQQFPSAILNKTDKNGVSFVVSVRLQDLDTSHVGGRRSVVARRSADVEGRDDGSDDERNPITC